MISQTATPALRSLQNDDLTAKIGNEAVKRAVKASLDAVLAAKANVADAGDMPSTELGSKDVGNSSARNDTDVLSKACRGTADATETAIEKLGRLKYEWLERHNDYNYVQLS